MLTTLAVINIIVVGLLIGSIMLQKSDEDSDTMISGSNFSDNFIKIRGRGNILTKATSILAFLFMSNSLLMCYLASRVHKKGSQLLKYHNKSMVDGKTNNIDINAPKVQNDVMPLKDFKKAEKNLGVDIKDPADVRDNQKSSKAKPINKQK